MISRGNAWSAGCTSGVISKRAGWARIGLRPPSPQTLDTARTPSWRWRNFAPRCACRRRRHCPRSARLRREEPLHALEETLAARRMFARVLLQRLLELAQQLALIAVELHRSFD